MDDRESAVPSVPRPPWAPEWYRWWPGEPQDERTLRYTIRECATADVSQAARLLGLSKSEAAKVIPRVFSCNDWSLWLVVRNGRYAVGGMLVRHGPEENSVLRLRACGRYCTAQVVGQLTVLASAALPECPVTADVPLTDTKLLACMRRVGWKATGSESCEREDDSVCHMRFDPVLA